MTILAMPCPCGSGRKIQLCCADKILDYLEDSKKISSGQKLIQRKDQSTMLVDLSTLKKFTDFFESKESGGWAAGKKTFVKNTNRKNDPLSVFAPMIEQPNNRSFIKYKTKHFLTTGSYEGGIVIESREENLAIFIDKNGHLASEPGSDPVSGLSLLWQIFAHNIIGYPIDDETSAKNIFIALISKYKLELKTIDQQERPKIVGYLAFLDIDNREAMKSLQKNETFLERELHLAAPLRFDTYRHYFWERKQTPKDLYGVYAIFSDGVSVQGSHLTKHPYQHILGSDTSSKKNELITQGSTGFLSALLKDGIELNTEFGKLFLCLRSRHNINSEFEFIGINSLEQLDPKSFKVTVDLPRLELKYQNFFDAAPFTSLPGGFLIDRDAGKLLDSNLPSWWPKDYDVRDFSKLERGWSSSPFDRTIVFDKNPYSKQIAQSCINDLISQSNIDVDIKNLITVDSKDTDLKISISEDSDIEGLGIVDISLTANLMGTEREFPGSTQIAAIVFALYQGLGCLKRGGSNGGPTKKLAGKYPVLFEHRGIALFTVYRCTSLASLGIEDGLTIEGQVSKIFEEVKALACSCGGGDQKELQSAYSKTRLNELYEIINKLARSAIDHSSQVIVLKSDVWTVCQLSVDRKLMQAMHAFCQSIIDLGGLEVFKRKHLKSLPLKNFELYEYSRPHLKIYIDRVKERLPSFMSVPETVVTFQGKILEQVTPDDFRTEINLTESSDAINWFSLHPKTFFKGQEISVLDTKKFQTGRVVEHQGRYFLINPKNIPTLKWLDFFWSNINQSNQPKLNSRFGSSDFYKTAPNEVLNLLALKKAGIPIIGGDHWRKLEATFESLEKRAADGDLNHSEILKKSLDLPLKDFQTAGVQWLIDLYNLGIGGVLADEMGLGKTLQTIALFKHLYVSNQLGKSLVVVPTSLRLNWVKEIEKFSKGLPVEVFDSKFGLNKESKPSITIVTYGLLLEHQDVFTSQDWNVVVFDEAQNLKNILASRTTAARQIKAKVKFALTGTPMENSMSEFYSIMDLVASGSLGKYEAFMEKFRTKLTQTGITTDFNEQIQFLKLKTSPLILRRTKKLMLKDLPEKNESTVILEFEKGQKKIYRDTAIAWNEKIQTFFKNKEEKVSGQIHILTALLRLRQICSFPESVPGVKHKKLTPKFETLIDALTELKDQNEPVVVFTTFKSTLVELEKAINLQGFNTIALHGEIPIKKREVLLDQFQRATGSVVLMMTQKVGGVGLNLTKARYVFHIEPWWNPAVENQATDRVHRMGQTQHVQVYRYIMNESVEEKIQLLKSRKGALFESLFGVEDEASLAGAAATGKITREDFEYLIG